MNEVYLCCRHCWPQPDTGRCWAEEGLGHGSPCLDCPETEITSNGPERSEA